MERGIIIGREAINEIVSKVIGVYLTEYHHSYDNGLYRDAANICDMAMSYAEKGWDGSDPITYKTASFGGEPTTIYIYLIDNEVSQFQAWSTLRLSKPLVEKAIETNGRQKLMSIIYHELGHMVNVTKSNSLDQIRRDVNVPLMLGLGEDEYQSIRKVLYRFNSGEMKARCFETAMFISQNKGKDLTIGDIYDNRCSDVTLMRNFVNYLRDCSGGHMGDKDKRIIKELYDTIYNKNILRKSSLPVEDKARKLYGFFNGRLDKFKRKIDKIYNDYINRND